ncbi:MAG TPA: ATP-grasp domain-containing protein [Planctomycetota bacterium]|nr:ATP-grasp domain-containing protein [Planctomycetota bacterium]
MNVLLTCGGRRILPIKAFQEALRGRGRVFACDCDAHAPALRQADRAFVVPRVDEVEYIEDLLSICRKHRVGLLVPALEPELPLLAAHRERFLAAGTFPLVPPAGVVDACYDKLATAAFLAAVGIASPITCVSFEEARVALASGAFAFPLVVKPRWGMGSLGLHVCADEEELELAYKLVRCQLPRTVLANISATDPERSVLIQECLSGLEYGFDVINDLRGNYVCTFLRKKLRMRAGQTDRAVTVHDPSLERVTSAIGKALGHFGPLDGDLLVTPRGIVVLDLNPRLGGGYPFSHVAGANLPAALVAWAANEAPDPAWLRVRPDVMSSKIDEMVLVRDEGHPVENPLEEPLYESRRGM